MPEPAVAVGEDPRTLRAADVGCLRRDDGRAAGARAAARGDRRLLAAADGQGHRPRQPARAGGRDRCAGDAAALVGPDGGARRGLAGPGIDCRRRATTSWSWPTRRAGCCGGPARRRCCTTPTGSGSSRARTGARAPSAPTPSAPRWCPTGPCRCSPPSTSCAATTRGPVRARRSGIRAPGRCIGVVDVSGPAATVHPTTVALVDVGGPARRIPPARTARPHAEPAAHRRRADPGPHRAGPRWPSTPTAGSRRSTRCHCTTASCCPTNSRPAGPGSRRWACARSNCYPAAGWCGSATTTRRPRCPGSSLDLRTPGAPALDMVGQFGVLAPRHFAAARRDPARARDVPRGSVRTAVGGRPLRRPHPGGHGAGRNVATAKAIGGFGARSAVPLPGDGGCRGALPRGHVDAAGGVDRARRSGRPRTR